MTQRLTDDEIQELRHLHAIATDRAAGPMARAGAQAKLSDLMTWNGFDGGDGILPALLDEIEERRRIDARRLEELLKRIPAGTPGGLTDTAIMRALREMQGKVEQLPSAIGVPIPPATWKPAGKDGGAPDRHPSEVPIRHRRRGDGRSRRQGEPSTHEHRESHERRWITGGLHVLPRKNAHRPVANRDAGAAGIVPMQGRWRVKTIDDYFADWEAHVFGMGYGTGEKPVLGALKTFLETCAEDGCYNHRDLESACGAAVAWLLITILVRADVIEYGTSPRFGWLDTNGKALRDYVSGRSVDALFEVVYRDQDYVHCFPDRCQCDDGKCANPFWSRYAKDGGA